MPSAVKLEVAAIVSRREDGNPPMSSRQGESAARVASGDLRRHDEWVTKCCPEVIPESPFEKGDLGGFLTVNICIVRSGSGFGVSKYGALNAIASLDSL